MSCRRSPGLSRVRFRLLPLFLLGLVCLAAILPLAALDASPRVPQAASQEPEAPPTRTLTGWVVDLQGTPVAGAEVELIPQAPRIESARALLAGDLRPAATVTVRTDEKGRYELPAPVPGVWRIRVGAEGRLPVEHSPLPLVGPGPELELPMAPLPAAVDQPVVVQDDGERPVPTATAWLLAAQPGPLAVEGDRGREGNWTPAPRIALTDLEGRAVLPRGRTETVERIGWKPGHVPVISAGEAPVRLPGSPTRSLRLLDPQGRPVADAVIGLGAPPGLPVAVTDAEGRVSVPVSSLDRPLAVTVLTDEGLQAYRHLAPLTAPEDGEVPPEPFESVSLEAVSLEAPRTISGRVISSTTSRPLAGALVWSRSDPGRWTLTDRAGRFEIDLAAAEEIHLQAEAVGHRPRQRIFEDAELDRGRPVALALPPGTELPGRVVDREGRPLADARIELRTGYPGGRRPYYRPDRLDRRAWSDEEGSFLLPDLEAEKHHRLRVDRDGYLTALVEAVTPAGGRTAAPLTVVLDVDRAARGRVLDPQERPIAGAVVVLTVAGRPRPRPGSAELREGHRFRAETDPEGRFQVPGVPADTVDIHALHPAFLPMTVRGVEIPSDSPVVDLGDLVMARGERVSGRVVDQDGAPVPGAEIRLLPPGFRVKRMDRAAVERLAPRPATTSDPEGRFHIEALESEVSFHLLVQHPEYQPGWVEHVSPPVPEPLWIRLEPGAYLRGRVVDETDAPVPSAEIAVKVGKEPEPGAPDRTDQRTTSVDGEGRFTLDGLPLGPARVQVFAPGWLAPEPLEITLPPETDEELVLVVRAGNVLEGRVTTTAGDPVEQARVLCHEQVDATDAEGRYRMQGLPEGTARLEVTHSEYPSQVEEIALEEGDNRFDVTLPDGVPVAGRVVDPSGEPVPGARFVLERDDLRNRIDYFTVTDAEGELRLASVSAGTYRLEVSHPGLATLERHDFVVGEEPIENQEWVLEPSGVVTGYIVGLELDRLARTTVQAEDDQGRVRPGRVRYDGAYRIEGLATGPWRLRAWTEDGSRQAQKRIVLTSPGEEAVHDLELGTQLTLSGEVRVDGEPLVGARISLRGLDSSVYRSVLSDHEGRFRMEDVAAGRYHLGVAHGRELVVHNETFELDGDREVILDLAPAQLSGRVLADDTGQGVADALIVLRRLIESPGEEGLVGLGSGADGRFRFTRIPPGRYRLEVRHDGFAAHDREMALAAGEEAGPIEVRLEPTPGWDLFLRGPAPAASPPWASVAFLDAAGQIRIHENRTVTADGRLRLPTTPPGSWRLLLGAPGAAGVELQVELPAEPLEVPLQPAAALEVEVPALLTSDQLATAELLAPDGRPLRLLDPMQGQVGPWTLVGGRARLDHLPAGAWRLVVQSRDGRRWESPVVTAPGSVNRVVLE